jgi:hypothetical protein
MKHLHHENYKALLEKKREKLMGIHPTLVD